MRWWICSCYFVIGQVIEGRDGQKGNIPLGGMVRLVQKEKQLPRERRNPCPILMLITQILTMNITIILIMQDMNRDMLITDMALWLSQLPSTV